jgi:hypothetical protein
VVPDEICIAVSLENDDPDPTQVYAAILTLLGDSRLRALTPAGRKSSFRINIPLVGTPGKSAAILFYKVSAIIRAQLDELAGRPTELERIQPLINLIDDINRNFGQQLIQQHLVDDLRMTFLIATPNVYATASGGVGEDSGSPAAPPQRVPPITGTDPDWTFHFSNAAIETPVSAARAATASAQNVVVAILDTLPDPSVLNIQGTPATGAGAGPGTVKFPNNRLFGEVAGKTGPGAAVPLPIILDGLPPTFFDPDLQTLLPDWPGLLGPWFTAPTNTLQQIRDSLYAMPDHGLFVAGIIKDIMPTVPIHLIQMMEDGGTAKLENVFAAFDKVIALANNKHVVLNASWNTSTLTQGFGWAQPVYDIVVKSYILALGNSVLVVAATGNNNGANIAPRPGPRYPAAYDQSVGITNVLSVAAMKRDPGKPFGYDAADYSNTASQTGIATIGGNAIDDQTLGQVALANTPGTNEFDAIKGIFWEDDLPFNAGHNDTGWVYWAGTSFATPIIAAIAALIWENQNTKGPDEIIGLVQGLTTMGVPGNVLGANVRAILAYQ